jgi:light-regulated signal transduction histidine kinase (bacteriophytochrome)
MNEAFSISLIKQTGVPEKLKEVLDITQAVKKTIKDTVFGFDHEMSRLRQKIKMLNEEKKNFLASVSHVQEAVTSFNQTISGHLTEDEKQEALTRYHAARLTVPFRDYLNVVQMRKAEKNKERASVNFLTEGASFRSVVDRASKATKETMGEILRSVEQPVPSNQVEQVKQAISSKLEKRVAENKDEKGVKTISNPLYDDIGAGLLEYKKSLANAFKGEEEGDGEDVAEGFDPENDAPL